MQTLDIAKIPSDALVTRHLSDVTLTTEHKENKGDSQIFWLCRKL